MPQQARSTIPWVLMAEELQNERPSLMINFSEVKNNKGETNKMTRGKKCLKNRWILNYEPDSFVIRLTVWCLRLTKILVDWLVKHFGVPTVGSIKPEVHRTTSCVRMPLSGWQANKPDIIKFLPWTLNTIPKNIYFSYFETWNWHFDYYRGVKWFKLRGP